MRVGIPKEHAARENRIAAVPASVKTFVDWEWDVAVETGAGVAAGGLVNDWTITGVITPLTGTR